VEILHYCWELVYQQVRYLQEYRLIFP